jgi:hypothetical protein
VIRVQASGTIDLDGTMTSEGGLTIANDYSGGGSGGSIYLSCKRFTGNGLLGVPGGNGGTIGCGGGSGGRIAVWSTWGSAAGITTNASGGTGHTAGGGSNGAQGTVFFGYRPPSGTMMLVR